MKYKNTKNIHELTDEDLESIKKVRKRMYKENIEQYKKDIIEVM
jgi:hypothetical protein